MTFSPSDSTDYTTATATVTVNVAKATPTISAVNAVDIIYGTALANTQLTGGTVNWTVDGVSTAVSGAFTYTSAEEGRVLNASTSGQTETVTFSPSDSTDYATATATVTVNVAKATPMVSVTDNGGP